MKKIPSKKKIVIKACLHYPYSIHNENKMSNVHLFLFYKFCILLDYVISMSHFEKRIIFCCIPSVRKEILSRRVAL